MCFLSRSALKGVFVLFYKFTVETEKCFSPVFFSNLRDIVDMNVVQTMQDAIGEFELQISGGRYGDFRQMVRKQIGQL